MSTPRIRKRAEIASAIATTWQPDASPGQRPGWGFGRMRQSPKGAARMAVARRSSVCPMATRPTRPAAERGVTRPTSCRPGWGSRGPSPPIPRPLAWAGFGTSLRDCGRETVMPPLHSNIVVNEVPETGRQARRSTRRTE
jgi:hypothetical protein